LRDAIFITHHEFAVFDQYLMYKAIFIIEIPNIHARPIVSLDCLGARVKKQTFSCSLIIFFGSLTFKSLPTQEMNILVALAWIV